MDTSNPVDVPPFQLQRLIPDLTDHISDASSGIIQACSAQALGSELFVGCSNGNLLRFSLQAGDSNKIQSQYTLLSSQRVPGDAPIDEIVLIPSVSRALILSGHQIHFYAIPSLDLLPIKPIRHVITFAVDDHHLKRPAASPAAAGVTLPIDALDFCVIKRTGIALYSLKDRLSYIRDVALPQIDGALVAKRAGKTLCIADKSFYHIVDLQAMSAFPLLPISQAHEPAPFEVRPSITVVGPSEFLLLSWTGTSTLGLFITGNGDPVRGTLEWLSHPEAICLDFPYVTSLLPDNTIQIHNIDTQTVIQVISNGSLSSSIASSPAASSPIKPTHRRQTSSASSRSVRSSLLSSSSRKVVDLISASGGYVVPSTQKLDKMRKVAVPLLRS